MFYFTCFVIECISFKQNSRNGNYFSKLWGGVSVFTGMNQPCEWNENYARHLLSKLCVLQANTEMKTNILQLIFNHSSTTQSVQGVVQIASSSDLVHVRFITVHLLQVASHVSGQSQALAPIFRVGAVLTLAMWSEQTLMAKTNKTLILFYLCMMSASYPNKSS